MLQTGTWRRKGGLADWAFALSGACGDDEALERWSVCYSGILDAMQGFASPRQLSFSTLSKGEDSAIFDDRNAAMRYALRTPDIDDLVLRLDLLIALPSGEQTTLPDAATLWLTLDRGGDPAVHTLLSLDVDLYAPVTRAANPDNRALAALNAPRLASFLSALHALGTLTEIDAPSYEGLIGPDGFTAGLTRADPGAAR